MTNNFLFVGGPADGQRHEVAMDSAGNPVPAHDIDISSTKSVSDPHGRESDRKFDMEIVRYTRRIGDDSDGSTIYIFMMATDLRGSLQALIDGYGK